MKRGDSAKRDKSGRFGKGNGMAAKPGEVRSPDGGWATRRKLAEAREIVRERIIAEIEATNGAALVDIVKARLKHAASDSRGANEAAAMIFDRLDGRPLAKTEHSGGLQVLEGLVIKPGRVEDAGKMSSISDDDEDAEVRNARFVDDGR